MEEKWLTWTKQLQSIAQAGLAYSRDKYDLERFQQIRELSVEILNHYTEAGEEKIKTLFCAETGYQTPKVDVRGAIIKNNQILLVKESIDGCWSMPGGWADIGLSAKENIEKEAREEAGLEVKAKKLVGVFDWAKKTDIPNPFAIYKVVMLCEVMGGAFQQNIETEAAQYFSVETLPQLSKSRTTKELIQMCFKANCIENYIPLVD